MIFKKKRMFLLFFLFLGLLPMSYSKTCGELFCQSSGKVCVNDYPNESNARCADSCKENGLAVAPVGSCAINRTYCGAGAVLRNKCDVCGCPKGEKCQIDGTCQKVCKDGTLDGQCAAIKPFYCDGNLVQKSTVCGCEEGKISQSDGTCGIGAEIAETAYSDFSKGSYAGAIASRALNIALEGTAFASGTYEAPSSWWCRPGADKANDGKLRYECDWISPVSSSITQRDQYVGIEWGEDRNFNEIVFTQSFLQAKSYKIQYFKDGKWIDATKEKFLEHYPKDFAKLEENGENQIAERAVFEPVTSRKARIFFPQCYSACRIFEMEVYNSDSNSLKLDVLNGHTAATYLSQVYDTQTTQNNVTYDKFFFGYTVEMQKKSKSVNIAPLAAAATSSAHTDAFFLDSGPNLNDNIIFEYVSGCPYSTGCLTIWQGMYRANQWASFMFPTKKKINKVVFRQAKIGVKNFEIRAWDGAKWMSIVPSTLLPLNPNDFPTNPWVYDYRAETEVRFDTVETSGIQLFFPECPGYYGCVLAEVLIYEEADKYSKSENIAPQGTVYASGFHSGSWGSWEGWEDYVIDGSRDTLGWGGRVDSADWIQIEWPSPKTINKVNIVQIMPRVRCYDYYRLEYWDGSAWQKINKALNKGTPDDFGLDCRAYIDSSGNYAGGYNAYGEWVTEEIFDPVTTTKIRVIAEPRWLGVSLISEIEVFEPDDYPAQNTDGTSARFQIKTAPNNNGKPGQWTDWTGPDGTSGTYYEASGQKIHTMHNGNKFVQYAAFISTNNPEKTVSLNDVAITYSGKFNQKPIVNAKDREVVLGTPVVLNATANDIGGRIVSYTWDFGDNTTGRGEITTHNYANPGAYTAKVTVTDNDGANASANVNVIINTYNCLSEAAPKNGPGSYLFTLSDALIQQKATEALLEYAQSKGIKLKDIDTTLEYYEAANDYITTHTTYMPDPSSQPGTGWEAVPAKKLFAESGPRGCGNDYCGDCEDFAITTAALIRAMGVSPKCVYVANSKNHAYLVLNIGSKFRIVEPQNGGLGAEFNSKAYEWKDPGTGLSSYGTENVMNDEFGQLVSGGNYIFGSSSPLTYTLNYPGTSGLPDSSKKCPASYSIWKGEGDQTYFEDKCP